MNATLLYHETLFRLAKSVYNKTIPLTDIAAKNKGDATPRRDVVASIVDALPADLFDSPTSMSLTRELWKLIRPNDMGRTVQFTKKEMEAAMIDAAAGQSTFLAAGSKHGPPIQQLTGRMNALCDVFGIPRGMEGRKDLMQRCVDDAMGVMQAICTLSEVGGKTLYSPYLKPDEADLLNRVGSLSARTGTAVDVGHLSLMARNAIHASGSFDVTNAGNNQVALAKANRKLTAVVTKSYASSAIVRNSRLAVLLKTSMRKKSKMAVKRIRAMDPALETIGRTKVVAALNKLMRKGRVTLPEIMNPNNHHNMDEVAQSTNNRHRNIIISIAILAPVNAASAAAGNGSRTTGFVRVKFAAFPDVPNFFITSSTANWNATGVFWCFNFSAGRSVFPRPSALHSFRM